MNEPDTHAVYPQRQTTYRRWPGLVLLLAAFIGCALFFYLAVSWT